MTAASPGPLTADTTLSWVTHYQVLPQLWREQIIDRAIAPFECTPDETTAALNQFFQQRQLTTEADQRAWMQTCGVSLEQIAAIATRSHRIEKFKVATWDVKLESYFLERARQLDRAIYSLIRVKDRGVAQELYFRIESGEQSFAAVAHTFSEGPEANTQGLIGPIEMGSLLPPLAHLLRSSQPGEMHYPIRVGEWFVIARLEKFLPVQFDQAMRQRLLQELFERWLQEQLSQLPEAQKLLIGLRVPASESRLAAA